MSNFGSPIDILLIENDSADVRLIDECFVNQLFALNRQDSLQNTLNYLRQHHPDLILLDLDFNDSNVLDVFKVIHEVAASIPIIALATSENEAVAKTALKAGAQDYLIKTEISAPILTRAINSAIERQHLVNQGEEQRKQLAQKARSNLILSEIVRNIHSSLDLVEILPTAVNKVNQFLQAENLFIGKVEHIDNQISLSLLFESSRSQQDISCKLSVIDKQNYFKLAENYHKLAAGKTVAINNALTFALTENPDLLSLPLGSKLSIPIICQEQLWGLLCAEHCTSLRTWQSHEIELLKQVAIQLAIAIQQAELYHQLEQANQELEKLTVIDSLTNIANRRKFDQYITSEWQRLAREQAPLSLILCDIDYFKLYNDTYGHQAGDRCIKWVARAIEKAVKRPADLLARYGGEEFAIILPNTAVDSAECVAQQIRSQIQALELPHIMSPIDIYITLSMGVAGYIPSHDSADSSLIAAADSCLYRAKELGRNRIIKFTGGDE